MDRSVSAVIEWGKTEARNQVGDAMEGRERRKRRGAGLFRGPEVTFIEED